MGLMPELFQSTTDTSTASKAFESVLATWPVESRGAVTYRALPCLHRHALSEQHLLNLKDAGFDSGKETQAQLDARKDAGFGSGKETQAQLDTHFVTGSSNTGGKGHRKCKVCGRKRHYGAAAQLCPGYNKGNTKKPKFVFG